MAGKLAATVGSNHTCAMCTGTTPHVGGPITQGEPNVLFNGKPVATIGSMCTCVGPPDMVVQGNPTVLVNGKPIACVGDMTAHGGVIVSGEANIIVGSSTPASPTAVMPIKKIPFPEITITNRLTGNSDEAIANQEKIKELAENNEGPPQIYNLQWIKEEKVVASSKVSKEVTLRASVNNIADGERVAFKVKKMAEDINSSSGEYEELVEVAGTVKDKMVEVVWEVDITNKAKKKSKIEPHNNDKFQRQYPDYVKL
ncbi:PAAR domain-containing protein [Fulvivirga sp. 2943]|uniref:PAAR domain-containing protein n=2 Tax=Fulvivirga sediminis TaxID=2803949 RepID=A0A937K2E3_9BACT|nr:PAAR domain-containing protein [Fulvivirga sediminis]